MQGKRIGILFNPIAGRAKGNALKKALQDYLQAKGFQVQTKESAAHYPPQELEEFLKSIDVVLVVGGDGTLRDILFALASTQTPVYMLPCGNESLFARAFAMTTRLDDVEKALTMGLVSQHHIAQVNGKAFVTMASVGLDSEVIAKIAESRSGPIGHRGYIVPICQTIFRHTPPKIHLIVDGQPQLQGETGLLVIANSPEYAGNLNPVPEAASLEKCLHARFFPYRRAWIYGKFLLRFLLKQRVSTTGTKLFAGSKFQLNISSHTSFPIQADGEYVSNAPAEISVLDQTIAVLSTLNQ